MVLKSYLDVQVEGRHRHVLSLLCPMQNTQGPCWHFKKCIRIDNPFVAIKKVLHRPDKKIVIRKNSFTQDTNPSTSCIGD